MAKSHQKIVLLGFMGCGKSTIGKALSSRLKKKFIDLDDAIEIRQEASISQLFEEKGEVEFRNIESEALQLALSLNSVIISLGGGTPCFNANMDKIIKSSTSIYLRLSPKDLSERLFNEREHRPLIRQYRSKKDLVNFISKKLKDREEYYLKASHAIKGDQTVDEIVEGITCLLDS